MATSCACKKHTKRITTRLTQAGKRRRGAA